MQNQIKVISSTGENFIINSALEPIDIIPIEGKADLIRLLSESLILHGVIIYMMCTLIYVFTLKLIADKDLYTPKISERVKSLPLGIYIDKFLTKVVKSWRISSNLWLYAIMIVVLIFICGTAFATYVALVVLQR